MDRRITRTSGVILIHFATSSLFDTPSQPFLFQRKTDFSLSASITALSVMRVFIPSFLRSLLKVSGQFSKRSHHYSSILQVEILSFSFLFFSDSKTFQDPSYFRFHFRISREDFSERNFSSSKRFRFLLPPYLCTS